MGQFSMEKPVAPGSALSGNQQTAHSDDIEAAAETRRRARQCGPDSVAFLHFVVRTDKFASSAQRVRSAIVLLEVGEFLAPEARATGLFQEAEEADGADGREAS